ncbi:MAG: pseudouridine synthase [Bacteroidota bacterium]
MNTNRYKKPRPKRNPKTHRVTAPKGENTGGEKQENLVRVNKYLSNAGFCSRRKADELIAAGRVKINGKVITNLGVKIDPRKDEVFINEQQIVNLDRLVYIVFNKPKDCITTTSDEFGRSTIMDYIQIRERVYPIGRLDRNTTGVLLLTNDGEFANLLMHPAHEVNKAYKVTLDKSLEPEHAEKFRKGIRLFDGKTAPAEILNLGKGFQRTEIGVVIHEGRNRQIHRMFEALGYMVEKLERVSYGGLTTDGLKRGEWRYLTKGEVNTLKTNYGS